MLSKLYKKQLLKRTSTLRKEPSLVYLLSVEESFLRLARYPQEPFLVVEGRCMEPFLVYLINMEEPFLWLAGYPQEPFLVVEGRCKEPFLVYLLNMEEPFLRIADHRRESFLVNKEPFHVQTAFTKEPFLDNNSLSQEPFLEKIGSLEMSEEPFLGIRALWKEPFLRKSNFYHRNLSFTTRPIPPRRGVQQFSCNVGIYVEHMYLISRP